MSKLFNTLSEVLTPYANKINLHTEEIEEIQGDVSEVKADLNDYYDGNEHIPVYWESGAISNVTGEDVEDESTIRCGYIDLTNDLVSKIKTTESLTVKWYWYDEVQTYIDSAYVTINGNYNFNNYYYLKDK